MDFNIFKPNPKPIFQLDSIGPSGIMFGVIRARDSYDRYYDFKVNDSDLVKLESLDRMLGADSSQTTTGDRTSTNINVHISTDDYYGAMVRPNVETGLYPAPGVANVQTIQCSIDARGMWASPVNGQMTAVFNGSPSTTPFMADTTRIGLYSDKTIDWSDSDAARQRSTLTAHVSTGANGDGTVSFGAGEHGITMDPKNGMSTSTPAITHGTQETNHGAGMFTTSLNFLQHYFIGLGNAVALPMPHMVNIIKMVAIGGFIKVLIGSKKDNTGIYGLVSTIEETAKK